jgi:nicotinamide mononucleotide transporter
MKINRIKNKLFFGWTTLELIWLFVASAIILALSFYWKDNLIGISSALTGVWCVIFLKQQ